MYCWRKITKQTQSATDERIQHLTKLLNTFYKLVILIETLTVIVWLVLVIISLCMQIGEDDSTIKIVYICLSAIGQFFVYCLSCWLLNIGLNIVFHIIITNEIAKRQQYLKQLNIDEDKYDENCLRYDGQY